MKKYPISTMLHSYRGKDPRKQAKTRNYNRIAARVEKYINDDMARQPADCLVQYLSYFVARDLGEDPAIVKSIVSGIDAGSNGVTIVKGDFGRAMAALSQPPT